jgi:SnoaL-like protein
MALSIESAIARESIREALAQYSMLLDGDGVARDARAWADKLFTPDAVFISHYPDGTEQIRIEGREAIYKTFGRPGSPEVAGRHFMVNTVFDELSPTTAKTRTSALIQVSKRDQDCARKKGILNGGQPVISAILVYHDTWVLDGGEWKKKLSVLRRDT